MKRVRWAFAVLALLAGARAADADPSIVSVEAVPARGVRVDLHVDVAMEQPGRVKVDAEVGGRTLHFRRRVRAGSRSLVVRLDARRARVRRTADAVRFAVTVTVEQRGGGTDVATTDAVVPVPLIVLPGFANETSPGGWDAFATTLDTAMGGRYGFGGRRSRAIVHEYDSTKPLGALAVDLDRAARRLRRGTPFTRVDVVGYSMGGLVARQWLADRGKGRVRRLLFLGTPNEGAPIAYVAATAANSGFLDEILAGISGADLGGFADALVSEDRVDSLRVFYPTYEWAEVEIVQGFPVQIGPETPFLGSLLPDAQTPLLDLNRVAPDPDVELHAFFYTSVLPEVFGLDVGTVDVVNVTPLLDALNGGTLDPATFDLAALASGDGDGVVPAHSVRMDEVPAWGSKIVDHDLGAGSHLTFDLDPAVYTGVAEVLSK